MQLRSSGSLVEGSAVAVANVRWLCAAGVLRLLSRVGLGSAEALAAATSVAADLRLALPIGGGSRKAISPIWCWCAATSRRICRGATTSPRSGRTAIWWRRAGGPAAAGQQAEAVPAPAETLDGLEARFGGWDVTSDQMKRWFLRCQPGRPEWCPAGDRGDRSGTRLTLGGSDLVFRERPMQPVAYSGGQVIRFWTRGDGGAALGDAGSRPRSGRAAAHCDIRRAQGVAPGGDPVGGLPNDHAGDHYGAGVRGGGADRCRTG